MQITEDDGMNTILETVHSRRNTCQFTVLRAYSRTIPILKIRGSFSTNRQLDRRVVTFATAHSSDPALMGRLTRISVTYYVNRALRERERGKLARCRFNEQAGRAAFLYEAAINHVINGIKL